MFEHLRHAFYWLRPPRDALPVGAPVAGVTLDPMITNGTAPAAAPFAPSRPPRVLCARRCRAARQEERETRKPALHGKHWVAITGKPLAATAGALTFARGGNAVDAACAMLAAAATMWDTLSWGGETQALIFDPRSGKVRAINALGVAPTGATPEFFRSRGLHAPPEYGPLAAVTPGTPGGLLVMLAEFGTLSLGRGARARDADGGRLSDGADADARTSRQQGAARAVGVVAPRAAAELRSASGRKRGRRRMPGEIFEQPELLATLTKLVEAEREALAAGKNRKQAILAAYERFYRGDIARELVAATQAAGG